jgi:hypothetical protein
MTRTILLEHTGFLSPKPRVHYLDHPFTVPDHASRVGLTLRFHKRELAQIFVALFDPNGFRGNRMNPGAKGDIQLDLWVAPDDSSEGGIAGALPAGTWRVQLDIERLGEDVEYHLVTYADFDAVPDPIDLSFPDNHIVRAEAGWYRGELHAHSTESDGKFPVDTVIQAAVDAGLDFFALTDHFTISQWRKLLPHLNQPIALLRSVEITSHHGHANLHGMKSWVDVYVDRPDWSMNQAADAVHAQGGLFCVNHAYSGDLGWRAFDFDWDRADLMEIYHNLEGCNNAFQLMLWDQHLNAGRRIIGVGGIDSHNPFEGRHRLGQLVTWVEAESLSEQGILDGLRRGRVYVSRGPQIRFSASAGGQQVGMWESLRMDGQPVRLDIEVLTDEDVRVFVIKNGYYLDSARVSGQPGAWQTLQFEDQPQQPCYYRIELHSDAQREDYRGIMWRDHDTMRALSNPIWVNRA